MSDSEFKEIIQVKELIEEGKVRDALKIVSDLEKRSDISNHDLLKKEMKKSEEI